MNSTNKFFIFNGKMSDSNNPNLTWENRIFRYGDGLFETIRIIDSTPVFLEDHFNRLSFGMNIMKLKGFLDTKEIEHHITKTIAEENIIGGIIRLTIFRKNGGKYLPKTLTFDYLIEISEYQNHLELNPTNYVIDVYEEIAKPVNILGGFKSSNSAIYILASIFANENGLDDALLINTKNHIVEATSSNIFIRKGKEIFTPPSTDGPILGIIRNQILKKTNYLPYSIFENISITTQMVYDADEVFLTNSVWGIKTIGQFKDQRYSNEAAKLIMSSIFKKS